MNVECPFIDTSMVVETTIVSQSEQQSPPSKLHSGVLASLLQLPFPIRVEWAQSRGRIYITVMTKNHWTLQNKHYDNGITWSQER